MGEEESQEDIDEMFLSDHSNHSAHKRAVSFTADDLMRTPPRRSQRTRKRRYKEHVPPADKSIFDTVVSPVAATAEEETRHEEHPEQQLVGSPANNMSSTAPQHHYPPWMLEEVPDTNVAFSRSVFDQEDDAIRIPSLDSNLRWSPHNTEMVVVPNMGRRSLARAVQSGNEHVQSSAQLSILEGLKKITSQKTPPVARIAESEITDKDVICERGGKSNRHAGTKRYRGMIEKHKPTYKGLTVKNDKTNVSRMIIRTIQSSGGRFLKKDEETGTYFVLSPVETTKKVSQALREKKPLKWTEMA